MKRFLSSVAAAVTRVVRPFMPTPGTTEGAVSLGLVLLAVGFVTAGMVPLAFLVPGATFVILGSMPAIAQLRRGA